MRTRKPAASSSPACHRCTAVLFAGIERCGMCGWPAGVGYPPADGELDLAASTTPTAGDEVVAGDADHVGVQLEALAGMVARQGQPLPAEGSSSDSPEPLERTETTASPQADDVPSLDVPAPAAESSDDAGHSIEDGPGDPETVAEVDPLTAPLTDLTGTSDPTEPTLLEPTIEPDSSSAESIPAQQNQTVALDDSVRSSEQVVGVAEAQTAGRAASLLRPAQLLIVGTAAINLVLVGFDAVFGPTTGAMTVVVLSLALITLAVWTGAAVTFLHWVSRAHTHVTATASAPQRHGASMSLIGWFIPVAGFVIGYRVLQDLWVGSDPATRDDSDAAPAKVRMIDVWLLGIVTAALFGYAMPFVLGESAVWAALSGIGLLVAALSLVSVMSAISTWQIVGNAADAEDSYAGPEEDNGITATDEVPEAAPEPVAVSAE